MVGFARDMQIPNGVMFTKGLLSMMFAMGLPSAMTRLRGKTLIGAGGPPNEHIRLSPVMTGWDIGPT